MAIQLTAYYIATMLAICNRMLAVVMSAASQLTLTMIFNRAACDCKLQSGSQV